MIILSQSQERKKVLHVDLLTSLNTMVTFLPRLAYRAARSIELFPPPMTTIRVSSGTARIRASISAWS